jgi:hypothetical protein
MANEDLDQGNAHGNEEHSKAAGVSPGSEYPHITGFQNIDRNPQQNESANQGGGIQGTGQSQLNPGGYTGGHSNVRDAGDSKDSGRE